MENNNIDISVIKKIADYTLKTHEKNKKNIEKKGLSKQIEYLENKRIKDNLEMIFYFVGIEDGLEKKRMSEEKILSMLIYIKNSETIEDVREIYNQKTKNKAKKIFIQVPIEVYESLGKEKVSEIIQKTVCNYEKVLDFFEKESNQ